MSISSQIRFGFLAVLLTIVCPVLVGCSKDEKEEISKSSDSKESSNVKTVDGARETLLSVTANVPRLLNEIEKRASGKEADEIGFKMAKKLVGQLGVEDLHILLVSPKGNSLTPVVMIPDPTGKVWDSLQNGELSAFFEKTKDNSLRPKTEMAGDSTQLPAAVKNAVFRSVDRYVVAAEPALLDRIENDEWSPEKELAFQFVEKNKLPNSLVTVGIALPKKLPDSLGSMFSKEDLAVAGPAGQIGLGIVDSIYDQVREVAKAREAIAVSFQFEGNDGRQLKVAQQFVTAEAAKSAKQLIDQPPEAVAKADGLTKSLLAALNNDKLNKKLESGERSLHLTLSWKAADDQALSMHLKQAAMSGEMSTLR